MQQQVFETHVDCFHDGTPYIRLPKYMRQLAGNLVRLTIEQDNNIVIKDMGYVGL